MSKILADLSRLAKKIGGIVHKKLVDTDSNAWHPVDSGGHDWAEDSGGIVGWNSRELFFGYMPNLLGRSPPSRVG